MVEDPDALYWLLYLRWASGKRETICTAFPEEIRTPDARFVVLACLPMPRVRTVAGWLKETPDAGRQQLQTA